jgi:transcriptional regulator with XRE-family HTH domain
MGKPSHSRSGETAEQHKLTYEQKAKRIGVAKSALTRWKAQGCNVDGSIEEINEWRASFLDRRVRKSKVEIAELDKLDIPELTFTPSEGEDFQDALARLRKRERELDAEITATQEYLRKNANPKMRSRLPGLRKEHRDTVKDITAVHKTLASMNQGSELEGALECAQKYVTEVLAATMYWFKTFHSRFHCKHSCVAEGRAEAYSHVVDTMDKLHLLLPQCLDRSGLIHLEQRALAAIEEAKASSDTDPETQK